MARDYLSPGVGYIEVEEPLSRPDSYNQIIAIVGGAVKGPTELTTVTTQRKLKKLFGTCVENSYGVFAADFILAEDCTVIYKRVVGSAAAKGTAGAATKKFSFTTRDYDSTLNGCTIEIDFDTVKKQVTLILKNGNSIIEAYRNCSYLPTADLYLPKIMEAQGSVLIATDNTEVEEANFVDETLTIAGGNDGMASLTASDYAAAAEEFSNTEIVTINTIIVPGITDTAVTTAYAALARQRGDCMYVADIPFGTTPQTAVGFVNMMDTSTVSHAIDNQYVAVYGPWVKVFDGTRNKELWAPPSVVAVRVWAQSDNITGGCWFSPAGFSENRGVVPEAIEIEYNLTKDERDLWNGDGNVLNPIAYFRGLGIALFGNRTTRRPKDFEVESVFCSVNIRRMANYIKQMLIKISLTELFNPNDPLTWASWKAKINPRLKAIKDGRGLEAYKVVMDRTTISDEDILDGKAPGIIYVKPIRAIEYIPITFMVTENTVIFEEDENQEG